MKNEAWPIINKLATELGKTAESRRKARERGRVPHSWRLPLVQLARAKRIRLDPEAFDFERGATP